MVKKPSQIVREVLSGETDIKEVDEGIQSWCRFFIYQGAVSILSISTKEGRREALRRVPDRVRPLIKDEVMRLWRYRKSLT